MILGYSQLIMHLMSRATIDSALASHFGKLLTFRPDRAIGADVAAVPEGDKSFLERCQI